MKIFKLPIIEPGKIGLRRLKYLIMYFAIALCGIPTFHQPKSFKVVFIVFLMSVFVLSKKKIDDVYFKVIIFIFIIFLIQIFVFESGTIYHFGYIFVVATIPYLTLKIVGREFLKYYINILYFFAIISLIFYTISSIFPGFYHWTSTLPTEYNLDPNPVLKKGFIIYTWEPAKFKGLLRNPGPFWEPSVYVNYLILAIVFNSINVGTFLNKKNIIFILAILTSFSTGGYVALFIIIFGYMIYTSKVKNVYKIMLIPLLAIVVYVAYNDLDFLGNKIQKQWSYQISIDPQGTPTSGRFLGARKSLIAFSRHPLYGRGLVAPTAAPFYHEEYGQYGFLSVLSRLGIIGFIFWIYFFYKYPVSSTVQNKFRKKLGIVFFLAMLATNFNQGGYDEPLYFMVFYSGLLGDKFISDRLKK